MIDTPLEDAVKDDEVAARQGESDSLSLFNARNRAAITQGITGRLGLDVLHKSTFLEISSRGLCHILVFELAKLERRVENAFQRLEDELKKHQRANED